MEKCYSCSLTLQTLLKKTSSAKFSCRSKVKCHILLNATWNNWTEDAGNSLQLEPLQTGKPGLALMQTRFLLRPCSWLLQLITGTYLTYWKCHQCVKNRPQQNTYERGSNDENCPQAYPVGRNIRRHIYSISSISFIYWDGKRAEWRRENAVRGFCWINSDWLTHMWLIAWMVNSCGNWIIDLWSNWFIHLLMMWFFFLPLLFFFHNGGYQAF